MFVATASDINVANLLVMLVSVYTLMVVFPMAYDI